MGKKYKLGVIGAGFMANALIKGAINSKSVCPSDVFVCDVNPDSLEKISSLGVFTTLDAKEVVNESEFVLFAVKPQSLNDVLDVIKDCSCDKFISIMAGVKKEKIKSVFPLSSVARCMPNTPCSIGEGAVGLDLSDFIDQNDRCFVENLLSSLAKVVIVQEDLLNAVTGVSGSSPAYFYLFLKGIVDAGVKHGLNYDDAKKLATSTMIGAGKMIQMNPDKSIDELINAVCSKGGTTIQAINVYNDCNLSEITEKAVTACVERSKELEKL